ncbi:ribulose-phosphate 3-epimerase [Nematocida homosporus]|uniref:ribulose-phosphate 3-epimerase n=1 Tax=Nematocida homosporus TaxID=1912981 RepID=UPI00221E516C|nr:ribulose-phosphate 3-epimerase [Nematocida homosporus]KAI5184338.1 ribulose-phosphate 3-epimerase [Nematocida homosporus]
MKRIYASILNCDLLAIGAEIERLVAAGIKRLHLDLMDGAVTGKIFLGEEIVKQIGERFPELEIECHLMVQNPLNCIKNLELSRLSHVIVHTNPQMAEVAQYMKMHGGKLGVAISPGEVLDKLYIPETASKILIMGVVPGRGGQKMLSCTTERLREAKDKYADVVFGVDGGVNLETIVDVISADDFVLGSCLFNSDTTEVCDKIREILQ